MKAADGKPTASGGSERSGSKTDRQPERQTNRLYMGASMFIYWLLAANARICIIMRMVPKQRATMRNFRRAHPRLAGRTLKPSSWLTLISLPLLKLLPLSSSVGFVSF